MLLGYTIIVNVERMVSKVCVLRLSIKPRSFFRACRRRAVTEIGQQSWLVFWSMIFFVRFCIFGFENFVAICFKIDIWQDCVRFASSKQKLESTSSREMIFVISWKTEGSTSLILWIDSALHFWNKIKYVKRKMLTSSYHDDLVNFSSFLVQNWLIKKRPCSVPITEKEIPKIIYFVTLSVGQLPLVSETRRASS